MSGGNTTKVSFTGALGEELAAALDAPAGRPRAYALFAHCFSCSKDIHAARRISDGLRKLGYAVLRFDFTGLGGSKGDFANTNFSSNVDDLVKAADYLRDQHQAPQLIIGHSLGGAAAIMASGRIAEIKAVATIGAPCDTAHVSAQFADKVDEIKDKGEAEVSLAGRPFTIKKQFLDDIAHQKVTDAAKALKKPFLIFHAPLDETVGIDNATQLFVAAKHPKSFVSLDTADHLLTRREDSEYVAGLLSAWAERFLDIEEDEVDVRDHDPGAAVATLSGQGKYTQAVKIGDHTLTIDVDKQDGGDALGPNPTKVVEGALAACATITMQMYAARKNWPVTRATASVRLDPDAPDQDAHAARYLEKTITLEGDLDAGQRARLAEIADKCPVHRMLTNGVIIRTVVDE